VCFIFRTGVLAVIAVMPAVIAGVPAVIAALLSAR